MDQRYPVKMLRQLAGATHSKKVCRWLQQNGVPYRLDDKGQPIVLESAILRAFNPEAQQPIAGEFIPDLSKLGDLRGKKANQRRRAA